jgi:hypothetical protein
VWRFYSAASYLALKTTTRARARLYGIDVDVARRLLAKLRERPIPPEECCWFAEKAGK